MDARESVIRYVEKLLNAVDGVKALLLDEETAGIIGLVVGEGELMQRDVFFIDQLGRGVEDPQESGKEGENSRYSNEDGIKSMGAVVFVRPTGENVMRLRRELRCARFGQYWIVFSNVVRRSFVEEIADADENEVVSGVREYFADFYALGRQLVSLGVTPCLDAMAGRGGALRNPHFERTVEGVTGLLLALRLRPMIRFQGSSRLCRNLAERISVRMDQETALFQGLERDDVLLLILDRCEDPVTPLLNQWTYEAMVHELIGIRNNRVSLKKADRIPPELKEVVLDVELDEFYFRNRFLNFGELGHSLKSLVDAFEQNASARGKLQSINDMMAFVNNYPQFRKESLQVSKHVAIMGELSRLVKANSLLQVSQVEQDLACRQSETEHRRQVMEIIDSKKVTLADKLKLVLLYSLRYEQSSTNGMPLMREKLYQSGHGSDSVNLVTLLRRYAGSDRRSGDVFSNRSFFAKARNTVRRGIGGVDNVYTQHEPLLAYTLDDLLHERVQDPFFPLVRTGDKMLGRDGAGNPEIRGSTMMGGVPIRPPKQLIIFIAGGATYEEAKVISAINRQAGAFVPPEGSKTASAMAAAKQRGTRVVLAGSKIHNSASFLTEVTRITSLTL